MTLCYYSVTYVGSPADSANENRCGNLSPIALVAQWIEHGSPKAGVGGSIPLWGANVMSRDMLDG